MIEGPLASEGCDLADVVLSRYKSAFTLKLFVYSEKGTSIDECARLSRLVGDLIEGTDLMESGYTLEVSSPGLDRPLKTLRDFQFRVGETVRISFAEKGKKKRTAEIAAASEDGIDFKDEDEAFRLDLAEIEQAKIVF